MVIARDVDHTSAISGERSHLDSERTNFEPGSCGVDISGYRHDDNDRCDNWITDELSGDGECRVKAYVCRLRAIQSLEWMPAMLDYWWLNGIGKEGFGFLKISGFVLSYE
jgi:hypothetical protein